ncbi:MAG: response regulator transcription factor [Solirubrobacteraceae bacterium]
MSSTAKGNSEPKLRPLPSSPDQRAPSAAPSGGEPAGDAPSIVIADDHPATRLGVRMALIRGGFRVVAEAADRDGAVSAVLRERPDVCLLDVRMPGGGIEAARKLAQEAPSTSVVMLTVSSSTDDVLAALRAGAVGYLPKDTHPDRLPAALCGVLKGEAALPRALVGLVLNRFRDYTAAAVDLVRVGEVELSARESEILRMLRSGLSTAEIGELLSLSPITVRRHISAGVAKLGVADRDAAIRAIEPIAAA